MHEKQPNQHCQTHLMEYSKRQGERKEKNLIHKSIKKIKFMSGIDEQKTVTKCSIIPNIVNYSMVTGCRKKESNPLKINKKYNKINNKTIRILKSSE